MKTKNDLTRELLRKSVKWSSRLERLENRVQRVAVQGDVLPLEVFSLMEDLRRFQFELHHRIRKVQAGKSEQRRQSIPVEKERRRNEFKTCYDRAMTLLSPD